MGAGVPPKLINVKPGTPISARIFEAINHALRTQRIIPGAGIEVKIMPGVGSCIAASRSKKYIGKTAGVIAEMYMGPPPEPTSGTVRVWSFNGTNLVDTGLDVKVFNFGGATESNAWVWIEMDANGYWFLTAEACPSP